MVIIQDSKLIIECSLNGILKTLYFQLLQSRLVPFLFIITSISSSTLSNSAKQIQKQINLYYLPTTVIYSQKLNIKNIINILIINNYCILIISNIKNLFMQLTLSQLDFSVSLNACHDQVMHKMQVLTNMQIQLLRKFQHQLGNSQMHIQMIHDVRVMIVNLQEVYKDVKQYFTQMGIQFVYDFFRKIQVLMVCGYNFMSQALLVNVDKIQDKKNKQNKSNLLQCKVCKCTCPQNSKLKKRQIKQVQHYDYKISMLQNQQQKISNQIQNIYDKMMMQKAMIQKTKPSLAIRELQDMKEHIQNVMQSTNSIFEQTYMMKYVEFKNYLTQIKKPEDIVQYFISNMSFNMKEKFLKAMQKAIYKAQNMQQKLQRKHMKDIQTQTQKISNQKQSNYRGLLSVKPQKNTSLLTKQRKYNQKMIAQVQFIRKQLNSLMAETQKLKKQVQDKQSQRKKYQQDYQTLQQLYSKRALQLQLIQTQNKWLANQKQNQTKKLRLQIKQLKKDQVQTNSIQTQTYIAPNCVNSSTQTQIIYFQNQVQNQIINVLKKTNQKLVVNLNQKQKKIRQLKVCKDQMQRLKDCKVTCLGFLQDLRQVTTYKMNQLNKQNNKPNPDKITKSKGPIIPLNQYTSNNSVMITITKLSQQIKALLFPPNTNKNRIHQRRASTRKQSISSLGSRRSSKASEFSQKSGDLFFKNSANRKNSIDISQKQEVTQLVSQYKKSLYHRQYEQKHQKKSSKSQSSISQQKQSNKNQHSKKSVSSSGQIQFNNSFEKRISGQDTRRKSSFNNKKSNTMFQVKPKSGKNRIQKPVMQNISIQTDIMKVRNQNKFSSIQQYTLYGEYSQQTDITLNQLLKFQQKYQNQSQQIIKLKNLSSSNLSNPQSFSTRKHPYIRKPGGRMTVDKLRSQQSERNFVSVNHTMPMNQNQISLNIQQHMHKSKEQFSFVKNNSSFLNQPPLSTMNRPSNLSNITLESRLSALINPKSGTSRNSNLIVFKRQNHDYQKRSTQLVFDELKLDKKDKQKQQRNTSFNTYQNESFSLNDKKQWKQMIKKIEQEQQYEKQNYNKPKNQPHLKSIFVQKIIEQDQNYSNNRRSDYQTLIQVSKKTPVQRQRRVSLKSYQPPENVFARAVKQMLLSTQSKQGLMRKIEEVYNSLEKQKQNKRIKKIVKGSYTPRNSDKRNHQKRKQTTSQLFKLGEILY